MACVRPRPQSNGPLGAGRPDGTGIAIEFAMAPHRRSGPAGLWAITSYFNPARYRRKLQNYRVFRERLAVPLVTAELAFDGFDLDAGDAEVLVRVRGGDVLWQKERLLN